MKRILIGVLLLVLPAVFGCEKQKFHYTATYDDTYPFEIDAQGTFEETQAVFPSRLNSKLDIPSDAVIEGVTVEELGLRVHLLPGNTAQTIVTSGFVMDNNQRFSDWSNFPIVLSGADTPYIGLNALIAEGVEKIRNKLMLYSTGLDHTAFAFQIIGASAPEGQRIHLQLDLRLRATIKYRRCLSVPREVFDGEKCD